MAPPVGLGWILAGLSHPTHPVLESKIGLHTVFRMSPLGCNRIFPSHPAKDGLLRMALEASWVAVHRPVCATWSSRDVGRKDLYSKRKTKRQMLRSDCVRAIRLKLGGYRWLISNIDLNILIHIRD